MTTVAILNIWIFLGLTSFFAAFIFWPLLPHIRTSRRALRSPIADYDFLLFERERVLDNLLELDNDFQTEKINPHDYQELKNALLQEASEIYQSVQDCEKTNPVLIAIERDLNL